MYIDLNSDTKQPIELVNWKQSNYNKTIRDYKVTNDYIYFNTMSNSTMNGYDYYKYDIKNKTHNAITKNEYDNIIEKSSDYITNRDTYNKFYLNGKELKITDSNNLVYDDKILYSSSNDITLLYSLDKEILFSKTSNCHLQGCDTIKYYKYDLNTNSTTEINFQTTFAYSMNYTLWKLKK